MTRTLLCLSLLLGMAASADAGIFFNRKGKCSNGSCSAVATSNGSGVTTTATACANGKCDLPVAVMPKSGPPVSPDIIVIDGKSYRLTPVSPP